MCPTETLVALKRKAIFGQFLSLIQDEIRSSYRTRAYVQDQLVAMNQHEENGRQLGLF